MATRVIMPKLGLTMKEGLVALWYKEEAETVEEGEDLLEIESDKVTTLIESPASGVVRKIIAEVDEVIPCGKALAVIAEADEDIPDLDEIIADTRAVAITLEEWEARQALQEAAPESEEAKTETEIKASPAARRLAREYGIDPALVKGTGPGGRIVREDVERARQEKQKPAEPSLVPYRTVEIPRMRRLIAQRVSKSKATMPHFYVQNSVDMTEARQMREQIQASSAVKVSYNDMVVKAVAAALEEYPQVNSCLVSNEMRLFEEINIGVVVDVGEGMIVPVLRDVNNKDLTTVAAETREMVRKARERKLMPDDLAGGTFTVTNLGMYDVDRFAAVIHPGQSAILAVGKITERPVVMKGKIEPRPMMNLTLSVDHRVIDGALAAEFLRSVKDLLEDPAILTEG